ncbi:hypothetical protein [Turicibacter sanguinis]|uniref:hypothetical protein n=1 Tax=Turicibacter sanguinis TaxID=154288 RepID=UPI0021D4F360|nr:hypothetical protein [Turicibacter sanguinis]MCU7198247.1 hypothetical protein [Turicibacter sanguinis]MDB8459209.1 hypothetical protein [Turicibacter sanguinis]
MTKRAFVRKTILECLKYGHKCYAEIYIYVAQELEKSHFDSSLNRDLLRNSLKDLQRQTLIEIDYNNRYHLLNPIQ